MLLNVREFWRSMITVLSQWEPLLFRGAADVAAFYKTRPVFCPSGQPKSGCSILLRAKLVWVLFLAAEKKCLAVTRRNSRVEYRYLSSVKKRKHEIRKEYLARSARTAMPDKK